MQKVTLDEAANRLRNTVINPFKKNDQSLIRDVEYLLACSRGADYDPMAFRAVTLNVMNFQRRGRQFFYCATEQRMRICGIRSKEIAWHARNVTNDHTVPLKFQYRMLQKKKPKDIFAIYKFVERWNFVLAVTNLQNREMKASSMPADWNRIDIFARHRKARIRTILMYSGMFRKIPKKWFVSH